MASASATAETAAANALQRHVAVRRSRHAPRSSSRHMHVDALLHIANASRSAAFDRYSLPALQPQARLPEHAEAQLMDLRLPDPHTAGAYYHDTVRATSSASNSSLTAAGSHFLSCAAHLRHSSPGNGTVDSCMHLLHAVNVWLRKECVFPGLSPAAWEGGKPGLTWRRHMHRVLSVAQDASCVVSIVTDVLLGLPPASQAGIEPLIGTTLAYVHECKLVTLVLLLEVMQAHAPVLFKPLMDGTFSQQDAEARLAVQAACAAMRAGSVHGDAAASMPAAPALPPPVPVASSPAGLWCCSAAPARDMPVFVYDSGRQHAHAAHVPEWALHVDSEDVSRKDRSAMIAVCNHRSAWITTSHAVRTLLQDVFAPFLAATGAWRGNAIAAQLFRIMLDVMLAAIAAHSCMQRVALTVILATDEPRLPRVASVKHRVPILTQPPSHTQAAVRITADRAIACAADVAYIHAWVGAGCPCILAPPAAPMRTMGSPTSVHHKAPTLSNVMVSPAATRRDAHAMSPASATIIASPASGAAAFTRSPQAGQSALITAAVQVQVPEHAAECDLMHVLRPHVTARPGTHDHTIRWLFAAHAQDAGAAVAFLGPQPPSGVSPGMHFQRAWTRTCLARVWLQCITNPHAYAAGGKESFLLAASPVRSQPRKYPRGSVVPITDDTPAPVATPHVDVVSLDDAAHDDELLRECAGPEGKPDLHPAPAVPHHGRAASGFARAAAAIDDASQPATPVARVLAWAADDALTPSIHVHMDAGGAVSPAPTAVAPVDASVQHTYAFNCRIGAAAAPWVRTTLHTPHAAKHAKQLGSPETASRMLLHCWMPCGSRHPQWRVR